MLNYLLPFLAWASVPAAIALIAASFQASLDLNALIEQLPFVVLVIYIIELRDRRWQQMMDSRDKQWQAFFAEQQANHKASMAEVAVALTKVSDQSAMTHELMTVHDQRVVSAIPNMQEAVRGQIKGSS